MLLVQHRRRRDGQVLRPGTVVRRPAQPERVRPADPAGLVVETVAQDTDHEGHVRGERVVRVRAGHARPEGPRPQAVVVHRHAVYRRTEERAAVASPQRSASRSDGRRR